MWNILPATIPHTHTHTHTRTCTRLHTCTQSPWVSSLRYISGVNTDVYNLESKFWDLTQFSVALVGLIWDVLFLMSGFLSHHKIRTGCSSSLNNYSIQMASHCTIYCTKEILGEREICFHTDTHTKKKPGQRRRKYLMDVVCLGAKDF